MLETGLKELFAASIAYLIWLGFWLVVASLVLTLFIPAIPLRDRSTTEERTRAAADLIVPAWANEESIDGEI